MKEIMLKAGIIFRNYVIVSVIDFPNENTERVRCKIKVEFAEVDVKQLISEGKSLEQTMDYYKDWLYNTVKVNIASDWICLGGYEEVMRIIEEHVVLYY